MHMASQTSFSPSTPSSSTWQKGTNICDRLSKAIFYLKVLEIFEKTTISWFLLLSLSQKETNIQDISVHAGHIIELDFRRSGYFLLQSWFFRMFQILCFCKKKVQMHATATQPLKLLCPVLIPHLDLSLEFTNVLRWLGQLRWTVSKHIVELPTITGPKLPQTQSLSPYCRYFHRVG